VAQKLYFYDSMIVDPKLNEIYIWESVVGREIYG